MAPLSCLVVAKIPGSDQIEDGPKYRQDTDRPSFVYGALHDAPQSTEITFIVVRCKRQTKRADINDSEFKALEQGGGWESNIVEEIVLLNWKIYLCSKTDTIQRTGQE